MKNFHPIYLISAADEAMGIGKNTTLPWHLSGDLKHFQQVTTETKDPKKRNMVVMGRTTWISIPEKHRPFKNRKNVVLTRNPEFDIPDVATASSLDQAFSLADESIESIFVIGGGSVYAEAIQRPEIDGIYLTRVHKTFDCDTFFPKIPAVFGEPEKLGEGEDFGIRYEFQLIRRAN